MNMMERASTEVDYVSEFFILQASDKPTSLPTHRIAAVTHLTDNKFARARRKPQIAESRVLQLLMLFVWKVRQLQNSK